VNKEKTTWKKADRMNAVKEALHIKSRTIAEICDWLNIPYSDANHRAINRDITDLQARGCDIASAYSISNANKRQPVYTLIREPMPTMKPDEALAAHVALRLLYHHTSNPPRSYRNALEKIALTLPKEMQSIAGHSILQNQSSDDKFSQFEKIARCWNERQAISFDYLAMNTTSHQSHRVEIEPYFVEISRSNFEIYVIGRRTNHAPYEVRTFMLTLMKGVTPLKTTYEIPEDFDPQQFLSNAWGVIGDRNPVIVRLKFSASVRRWLEQRQFPGVQRHENDEDNNLILTIQTGTNNRGEPQELIPWIRGWGANVEVLEPMSLRQLWLADARAVVEKFGGV
jgi:CRISPR-associated endonuclease/helicase Cas3